MLFQIALVYRYMNPLRQSMPQATTLGCLIGVSPTVFDDGVGDGKPVGHSCGEGPRCHSVGIGPSTEQLKEAAEMTVHSCVLQWPAGRAGGHSWRLGTRSILQQNLRVNLI